MLVLLIVICIISGILAYLKRDDGTNPGGDWFFTLSVTMLISIFFYTGIELIMVLLCIPLGILLNTNDKIPPEQRWHKTDAEYNRWLGVLVAFVLLSFFGTGVGYLARYRDRCDIQEINIMKSTLEHSRNLTEIENAAVVIKIIETNQEIGRIKRINKQWIGGYYTDNSVDTLTFVK